MMQPRNAVRVVLLDNTGQVGIVYVSKLNYYKIPGGGIEDGETPTIAAKREVMEESGCDCEIIAELGHIETVLNEWGMLDLSQGFLARVKGEKQDPKYEDHEKDRGFSLKWFANLRDAIDIITANTDVLDSAAAKLQTRDLAYLELAKDYLAKVDK